jgi:predicted phage replisome organizer
MPNTEVFYLKGFEIMGEKRFYWIKLKTDFFNQETIDFLLSQKNGCEYIVLYQMLCLQTANSNGQLSTKIGEMIIPYNVDKIVRDTKYFDFDTVTVALELFKKLGLIYQDDNNVLSIAGYDSMIGSETKAAERQRIHRSKQQKALSMCDNVTAMSQEMSQKNCDIVDTEIEIEKEIEKDIEIDNNNTTCYTSTSVDEPKTKPADIVTLFHDICKSYPKVRAMSENRRKAINARIRTHGVDAIKEVFEKAENSDFLKGRNNNNWSANFDWLMKDGNFCKVLDGNYDNKNGQQNYSQQTQQEEQPTKHRVIDWDNLPF